MNNYSGYWDKKLPENLSKSTYTSWLDEHISLLKKDDLPILDLGCGNGDDTNYLIDNGFKVVSADFSSASLQRVSKINQNTVLLDMSDFENWKVLKSNSFSTVIANLSLHYFDSKTTKMIMNEIKRILSPSGTLIARVNTTEDKEFGAGEGVELEPNFYKNLDRGIDKRFFTKDDVVKFFSIVGNVTIQLKQITYISKEKKIFEVIVKK